MDSHSRNSTHLIQTPERNSFFANIHQIDINYFVLYLYVFIDLLKCLPSISIIDIIVIRKNTREGGMLSSISIILIIRYIDLVNKTQVIYIPCT